MNGCLGLIECYNIKRWVEGMKFHTVIRLRRLRYRNHDQNKREVSDATTVVVLKCLLKYLMVSRMQYFKLICLLAVETMLS